MILRSLFRNKFYGVFLLIIFFLLYFLVFSKRLSVGYERIPHVGEILDERINVLSGISFLKTGVPTGWSNLSAYEKNEELHKNSLLGFDGISVLRENQKPNLINIAFFEYPIIKTEEVSLIGIDKWQISFVQPFFDHSPLGGIIYKQAVKDTSSIEKLDPVEYRFIPTHVLFWLNSILFFVVSYLLTKKLSVSILSFLIYTTVPSFVLSSRLAMLENLLIPLSASNLILLLLYKESKNIKSSTFILVLCGVVSGLAVATKESGIAVFIMSLAFLLKYKVPKKLFFYFLTPALILGSFFYVYFFVLSPSLAWEIFVNQTGRGFFGSLNFLEAIKNLSFHDFPKDGYWLFGFIALLILAKDNKNWELVYGFSITLIVYLFFGGLNYPWYSLPFIPFLVLSSALFISDLIEKPQLLTLLIFFTLPLSSSFYWGYALSTQNQQAVILIYRIVLISLVGFIVFSKNKSQMFILRSLIVLFCVVMFLLNIKSISFIVGNWGALPVFSSILPR